MDAAGYVRHPPQKDGALLFTWNVQAAGLTGCPICQMPSCRPFLRNGRLQGRSSLRVCSTTGVRSRACSGLAVGGPARQRPRRSLTARAPCRRLGVSARPGRSPATSAATALRSPEGIGNTTQLVGNWVLTPATEGTPGARAIIRTCYASKSHSLLTRAPGVHGARGWRRTRRLRGGARSPQDGRRPHVHDGGEPRGGPLQQAGPARRPGPAGELPRHGEGGPPGAAPGRQ
jgi:hypothetical protein